MPSDRVLILGIAPTQYPLLHLNPIEGDRTLPEVNAIALS
jgi:hypothetical protein